MFIRSFFKRWLPRHRRNRLLKAIDKFGISYHKKFNNYNYDWKTNGEAHVIRSIARHLQPEEVVFDVGANVGGWAITTSNIFNNNHIYSFEPLPETYSSLITQVAGSPNISPFNFGLAERTGDIEFAYNARSTTISSAIPEAFSSIHGKEFHTISCRIIRGDDFCRKHNIDSIALLKIDTEGFEGNVLRGFENMLHNGKIRSIQIEYGKANIYSGFLLKDIYLLLGKNYLIGKIYPRDVEFKEYSTSEENFLGPNYLAVLKTESGLIDDLHPGIVKQ